MVAAADGVFHELERDLMTAAQKHILHTDFDLDELEPISPAELAAAIPPEFAENVLGGAIIVSLIDGEASAPETELLQAYAKAMGLSSNAIKDTQRLVDQQMLRFRIDVLRRSFLGQRMKDFVKRRDLRGLVTVAKGVMGREGPTLARRRAREARDGSGATARGLRPRHTGYARRVRRLATLGRFRSPDRRAAARARHPTARLTARSPDRFAPAP